MVTCDKKLYVTWATDKKRIQKNRQQLLEYKQTLECQHCGISDHRILEFHHVKDKDQNVSRMVSTGLSWNRIKDEINKCIPLCCNCHRIEHTRLIQTEKTNAVNRYTPESSIYLRLYW